MPLLSYILGGSTFGLAARFWQLGLMKRNLFDNMGGHVLSMVGWAGAGAILFEMNRRNELLLEIKKNQLRSSREASAPSDA